MKQKQWLARKLWMVIALFFLGGLTLCLPEQAKAAETDGYDVDLCEELRLLPGHQYDCNRHIDGYNLQENYEVDDVEIKDISSNREDIVMVDAWEDEDGWCIKAGDSF
ncbi:MAG: hypothetical protein Q4D60_02695 [Eubacteriales bacterium]|nr:hypothetical protein [Eubacteriales bacterium]